MERRVLDGRRPRGPAGLELVLGQRLLHPPVGSGVGLGELVERERLADAPAQLVEDELELGQEQAVARAIARGRLEPPMALLPLVCASPRAPAAACA